MVLTWYDMSLENVLLIAIVPLVVSMVCVACKLGKTDASVVSHEQMPELEQVPELQQPIRETFVTIQLRNGKLCSPRQQQKAPEGLEALHNEQERRCCFQPCRVDDEKMPKLEQVYEPEDLS